MVKKPKYSIMKYPLYVENCENREICEISRKSAKICELFFTYLHKNPIAIYSTTFCHNYRFCSFLARKFKYWNILDKNDYYSAFLRFLCFWFILIIVIALFLGKSKRWKTSHMIISLKKIIFFEVLTRVKDERYFVLPSLWITSREKLRK